MTNRAMLRTMQARTPTTPITDEATLCSHWARILTADGRRGRTIWVMFHSEDGTPGELLLAVDEVPLRPDDRAVANLVPLIQRVVAANPHFGQCAVLLSRPGTSRRSPFEIEWAKALEALAGCMVWPVCCGTPHGVISLAHRGAPSS